MEEYLKLSYYFEDISISNELSNLMKDLENISLDDIVKREKENLDITNIEKYLKMYIDENLDENQIVYCGANYIDKTAIIKQKVIIGNNVKISPYAYIRPYSILLDNVSVGFSSEVKSTLILKNAKIASNTFVGDSIIGDKSRIGSGTILSNRRFDQKDISFKIGENKVSSNQDFYGSIIGNTTRIGANCTLFPGTLIGNNCAIYPNCSINVFIKNCTRVKIRQNLEFGENRKLNLK